MFLKVQSTPHHLSCALGDLDPRNHRVFSSDSGRQEVFLRPEQVYLNASTGCAAKVEGVQFRGYYSLLDAKLDNGEKVMFFVASGKEMPSIGSHIKLTL